MTKQDKIEKKKSLKDIHSNIIEKQVNDVSNVIKKPVLSEEEKDVVKSVIVLIEKKVKVIEDINNELTDLIDDTKELEELFIEDSNFEIKIKANIYIYCKDSIKRAPSNENQWLHNQWLHRPKIKNYITKDESGAQ